MKKMLLLSVVCCLSISVGAAVWQPEAEPVSSKVVVATEVDCEKIGVYENVLDPCESKTEKTAYERLSEQIKPSQGRDEILSLIQSLSENKITGGGVNVDALNGYLDKQIGDEPIVLSTICQSNWCLTTLTSSAEDFSKLEAIGDDTRAAPEQISDRKQTFATVHGGKSWLVMVNY